MVFITAIQCVSIAVRIGTLNAIQSNLPLTTTGENIGYLSTATIFVLKGQMANSAPSIWRVALLLRIRKVLGSNVLNFL